jgi:hypothetical protein
MMKPEGEQAEDQEQEEVTQLTIQIVKIQIQRMVMPMINLLRPRKRQWWGMGKADGRACERDERGGER